MLTVRMLGDYGPFSREGKSIGYSVEVDDGIYLLDCGAPLFQQIGGHGLKKVRGLLVTHCHDDHKRWFTDLALFQMYAPDVTDRVRLFTSETLHGELRQASAPALDRSLSADSRRVIDIPFENYVEPVVVGPRARWRIQDVDEGGGRRRYRVVGPDGETAGPETAKIVVSPGTKRPRMLFRDPEYDEWIEPENFYPFSSGVFYEDDSPVEDGAGVAIRAIKSPVWHGVPTVGFRITAGDATVVFSSDTVNDPDLWRRLAEEKRGQRLGMSAGAFDGATVIDGDINDYVERVWSRERFEAARESFAKGLVIHDVATRFSAVHTDYGNLGKTGLDPKRTILTHSPDRIVSEWCLGSAGKTFVVENEESWYEQVNRTRCPMDADLYYKEGGRYYVGYRNDEGRYTVEEEDGILHISGEGLPREGRPKNGTFRYRVDLYEDIGGEYFAKLDGNGTAIYVRRDDRRVELVEFHESGSSGTVVENLRGSIRKRNG